MIPKTIHYCWFGRKPLPKSAQKCIDSWRKYLPDYRIKEWNEDNFNIDLMPYVRQAYDAGKYAFVSDVARFWVIYNYGGVYFDTDVEVIGSLDDIIAEGAYMGCEKTVSGRVAVNPGLGFAAPAGMSAIGELLNGYGDRRFLREDGTLDTTTIVTYTTDMLSASGFVPDNTRQTCCGINIFPVEYFCPVDYRSGKCNVTENTYTIHHYVASWHSPKDKWAMLKRHVFSERQIKAISAFLDRFRKRH